MSHPFRGWVIGAAAATGFWAAVALAVETLAH